MHELVLHCTVLTVEETKHMQATPFPIAIRTERFIFELSSSILQIQSFLFHPLIYLSIHPSIHPFIHHSNRMLGPKNITI